MVRLLVPAILIASTTGCIIYDERIVYPEEEWSQDEVVDVVEDNMPEELPAEFNLAPSEGAAGDTVIVSIMSDYAPMDGVTGIEFYGEADIAIRATQVRSASELLVVMEIPEGTPEGAIDMLLLFDDYDASWLEDAFYIWPADGAPRDEDPGSGQGSGGDEPMDPNDPCP